MEQEARMVPRERGLDDACAMTGRLRRAGHSIACNSAYIVQLVFFLGCRGGKNQTYADA